ncbi:MAG TPA: PaaI family thioesterase [Acidimicrobiales bacterium]|nr:PaaI family thioesterase [Acidimicrobiales bacterium]
MSDDALLQERVRGVLAVPLHRWLGLRLADEADPAAGTVLHVGDAAVNNAGVLHGGLVAALCDVAAYLAVLPHLRPGTNAVTTASSVAIVRSAPAGATVTFRGQVVRVGRSVAVCTSSAHLLDEGGEVAGVVATGQVTKQVVATG